MDFVGRFPLIILAAGRSSRLGPGLPPKGILPWGSSGRTLLQEQLKGFAEAGGREVVIVLGFRREEYTGRLPWLVIAEEREVREENIHVRVTINPDPGRGPFSSLQCGLSMVVKRGEGIFVLPVDVPPVQASVWRALAETADALTGKGDACIPEYEGHGGHPVWLSAEFVEKLLGVPLDAEDARLDRQLASLPAERIRRVCVVDPAVRGNINEWKA